VNGRVVVAFILLGSCIERYNEVAVFMNKQQIAEQIIRLSYANVTAGSTACFYCRYERACF